MTLPDHVTAALTEAGLDPRYVEDLVRATLEEDLDGGEDVTSTATVPADQRARAHLNARAAGVIAGVPVVRAVVAAVAGNDATVQIAADDGDRVAAGQTVLTVEARTRDLLLVERTALNLASRLSGIATATRAWADAVDGLGVSVRDTRKTTPLMRPLEKYAVRVGGGANHRASLSDAALIKDNHVVAAGGVAAAYRAVRQAHPEIPVEVEVDDVAGAVEAVEAGATTVMLDNFTVDEVRDAVQKVGDRATLEISGGLSVDDARAYAETGAHYVSVGALTHSARALDLGLDLDVGVDGSP